MTKKEAMELIEKLNSNLRPMVTEEFEFQVVELDDGSEYESANVRCYDKVTDNTMGGCAVRTLLMGLLAMGYGSLIGYDTATERLYIEIYSKAAY